MTIEIWLGLALTFSVILNIFLLWFSRTVATAIFGSKKNSLLHPLQINDIEELFLFIFNVLPQEEQNSNLW